MINDNLKDQDIYPEVVLDYKNEDRIRKELVLLVFLKFIFYLILLLPIAVSYYLFNKFLLLVGFEKVAEIFGYTESKFEWLKPILSCNLVKKFGLGRIINFEHSLILEAKHDGWWLSSIRLQSFNNFDSFIIHALIESEDTNFICDNLKIIDPKWHDTIILEWIKMNKVPIDYILLYYNDFKLTLDVKKTIDRIIRYWEENRATEEYIDYLVWFNEEELNRKDLEDSGLDDWGGGVR